MSDIAQRMQAASLSEYGLDIDKELLDEGWREIERLRAACRDQAGVELSEENDRLIADNDRLRAALQHIVRFEDSETVDGRAAAHIARRELESKP